jgi:predicted MPP superfamily phosphohydrolase
MKIVYASDLHLEFNGWNKKTCRQTRDWEPGDVLVLAGDTIPVPYLLPHRTDSNARKKQASMKRLLDQLSPLYEKILMVGGNHEHYGYAMAKLIQR